MSLVFEFSVLTRTCSSSDPVAGAMRRETASRAPNPRVPPNRARLGATGARTESSWPSAGPQLALGWLTAAAALERPRSAMGLRRLPGLCYTLRPTVLLARFFIGRPSPSAGLTSDDSRSSRCACRRSVWHDQIVRKSSRCKTDERTRSDCVCARERGRTAVRFFSDPMLRIEKRRGAQGGTMEPTPP